LTSKSRVRSPAGDGPPDAFVVKDCAMTAMATGEDALTLRELRDRLRDLPPSCLYYHFWGRRLRPVYRIREFNNDFAYWAAHKLRDQVLAERLALVDPADHPDTASLRTEILELVEERVMEADRHGTRAADEAFHFLHAELVVFDTHRRIREPDELADLCSTLSPGSVFYHFVDARQRNPDGADDFQSWLRGFGDRFEGLRRRLRMVDVHFSTLEELREKLHELFCLVDEAGEAARV